METLFCRKRCLIYHTCTFSRKQSTKTGPNVNIKVKLTFQASQDNLIPKFDQRSLSLPAYTSVQIPKDCLPST